jgi:hypothetical protein
MMETMTPINGDEASVIRAGAHAAAEAVLRQAQRFHKDVTDLDVARVMRALETGHRPIRNKTGRWFMSGETPAKGLNYKMSGIINEMIRTGLVRHYRTGGPVSETDPGNRDHLIPALVHYRNPENHNLSACLFTGEDLGPMRARLVDRMDLVDCLACEAVIATGIPRGL